MNENLKKYLQKFADKSLSEWDETYPAIELYTTGLRDGRTIFAETLLRLFGKDEISGN